MTACPFVPLALLCLFLLQRPRRVAMRSMREANNPRRRRESRRAKERDRDSDLYNNANNSGNGSSFDTSFDVYGLAEWSADQLAEATPAELDSMGASGLFIIERIPPSCLLLVLAFITAVTCHSHPCLPS